MRQGSLGCAPNGKSCGGKTRLRRHSSRRLGFSHGGVVSVRRSHEILTARAGDQLVGLLPLYLLRENGRRKLLPVEVGLSDYIEVLRSSDIPEIGRNVYG